MTVEFADGSVQNQIADIAFHIDLAFDLYLSLRVLPAAVLEDPAWRLTGFVQPVEREGVPL